MGGYQRNCNRSEVLFLVGFVKIRTIRQNLLQKKWMAVKIPKLWV